MKIKTCYKCKQPKPIWKNIVIEGETKSKPFCKECSSLIKPYKKPNPVSAKRKEENVIYSSERIKFLIENPICQLKIPGICTGASTTIQHLQGRIGNLYLDKKNWKASCLSCNLFAADYSKEAIELGAAKYRNAKNED